jgi:divalent metal cation (Fe/Co/Zn/Cd) transporter
MVLHKGMVGVWAGSRQVIANVLHNNVGMGMDVPMSLVVVVVVVVEVTVVVVVVGVAAVVAVCMVSIGWEGLRNSLDNSPTQ